ncbi:MAG: aspartate--tRNA(Asn) ligase [Candidatus Aenigmatarchaeota archaeon]|nr:MAG: aspartate--tRNA(Asn) ligase [Candidatus Aenigmarchaeota archaeon]
MERKYSDEVKPGDKVVMKGWVAKTRDLGGLKFFLLRDRQGTIQVTAKKGNVPDSVFKKFSDIMKEYCVSVEGKVKVAKQTSAGVELVPSKLEIISKSEPELPIDVFGKIESGKDKRFDYRFLDVREPEMQAIFRIKARTVQAIREYFIKEGFIEIFTPVIQAAGAEGGATMFPVQYYDKKAYLRQSPQLYKQMMMASGMDKVFEIGQAFRAEKFHTVRHVSEFLSVDFEQGWIESEEDIMRTLEGMVHYSVSAVARDCKKELKMLGKRVNVPKLPFKRFTYDYVLKALKKVGVKLKWGDDIEDAQERKFGEIMAKKGIEWYFITNFPSKIKPFYIMLEGKSSRGIDLDFKGMEIASGGQREHRHDVLKKVMKEKGLDPKNFEFFLEPFRYGIPPHGGIGFGAERMVEKLLDLPDIKEAILFPRTPERLIP